jgi:hypothetical protein
VTRSSKRTSSRRASKKAAPPGGLKRWAADVSVFREQVGFDLSEPVGFSEYLLAVYGKGAPDGAARLFSQADSEKDYGLDASDRKTFNAWASAMAPGGLVCARGLHGLGFLPGDNISKIIFDHTERSPFDNYSMNLAYATYSFATQFVTRLYPDVTELWARSAAAIEPSAADAVGVQVRGAVDEWADARRKKRGLPPRAYWSSLSKRARDAILISQCPVVIVSRVAAQDMRWWGGDSESGDTMEAEVHVKHCEPRCVERFFVASAVHKLGRPVSASDRRRFALDEHLVVKVKGAYGEQISLLLHPDAPANGRVVRNLPDEWKWYDVEVKP